MNKHEMQSLFTEHMRKYEGLAYPRLNERSPEPPKPEEDYAVIYEAVFETGSEDILMMEFWLTDVGHVAVGIETRTRVGQRLGIDAGRPGFAAGHEPLPIGEAALHALLDAGANGDIAITFSKLLGRLGSTKAAMPVQSINRLTASGYTALTFDRMPAEPNGGFPPSSVRAFEGVLRYKPWSG